MASQRVIDYYFSFLSPWSYLGNRQFHRLAEKYNATIVYKPINLLQLFSVSGGVPVQQRAPQRQLYRLLEIERWSKFRDEPINKQPKYHPIDPTLPHRVLIAAVEELGNDNQAVRSFVELTMRALWVEERNISDPITVCEVANAAGLEGQRLVAQALADGEIAAKESSLTEEAKELNLFGVPTYMVDGEPFWGQDRLDLLENMLGECRKPNRLSDYT